jgi:alkylhydroperoxidase family enzyme
MTILAPKEKAGLMARLPYLDPSDLAPEHRDALKRPININRALAHSPNGTRAFGGLANYIRHGSRLDARLRELAILQVGYCARSPYEWSHHVEIGRHFGVGDADIRAIAEETAGRPSALEPLARTVLRAAREMSGGLAMTEETFAELRAGLDAECLTDLVITIGFYAAVVRVLATLQIDVEPAYLKYLEEFPLPA